MSAVVTRPVDPPKRDTCFIIAEAGVNHGGSTDMAVALAEAAASAGADAVKFQSYRTELLVRDDAPQAEYQRRNAPTASQADMLRALELSPDAHRTVAARCTELGIEFLSTPFDPPSLDLLLGLRVPRLKVGSGELTNAPMLLRMARTGLPMIVSTGMATLDEVADALAVIAFGRAHAGGVPSGGELARARTAVLADTSPSGAVDAANAVGDVTLLHCTSSYPAPASSANLRAMGTLADHFGLPIGYSDHTVGTAVAVAAVARGAVLVEKHLTLDRSLIGPDHAASLDPSGFAELVSAIRVVGSALGRTEKGPDDIELDVRNVARRSLVAARALYPGRAIEEADFVALRPGDGLPPAAAWDWIGRIPSRAYRPGEPFTG